MPREGTYLDTIVSAHRQSAEADTRDLAVLRSQALGMPTPCRGFGRALQESGLSVIAEIKRRSPSKGALNLDLDPACMAVQYATGGAACLSVLTDEAHFGGSAADLQTARNAVPVPVVRKDFTVGEADVYDARLMGADAVLLIAAVLSDDELGRFHCAAADVDLDVLVEIHDESELARALAVDATLIGVNQRDLHTFQVDQERAVRVGRSMPSHVVRVAESGVRGPQDAHTLAAAGFDAVLVGELLVTTDDPQSMVRSLRAL